MTEPRPRFPWAALLVLATGTLWTVTAELLPAGLLLEIGADTGVRTGTVGYLVGAWGLTIAALGLTLTRATRHLDRRLVLVGSLALTGSATLLTALAPSLALVVTARVVAAAGHGLFWAVVVVTAGSLVPREYAARAIAVVSAGPTVATVAGVPALTALGQATDWRLAFALVGLLTAVTGVLVAGVLPHVPAPPPAAAGTRDPSVPAVLRVAVVGALLLVAHFMAFTFIAPILTGPGGLPRESVSLALLVFGVAGAVGLALAPALSRRLPAGSLAGTGAVTGIALLAVPAAGGAVVAELAAVAAWGLDVGALPVVFQTRLLALASPSFRPVAGAVIVVAFNLGVAVGAAGGGLLHGHLGAAPLPLLAAAVALLTAAALATPAVRGPRPAAASGPVSREVAGGTPGRPRPEAAAPPERRSDRRGPRRSIERSCGSAPR